MQVVLQAIETQLRLRGHSLRPEGRHQSTWAISSGRVICWRIASLCRNCWMMDASSCSAARSASRYLSTVSIELREAGRDCVGMAFCGAIPSLQQEVEQDDIGGSELRPASLDGPHTTLHIISHTSYKLCITESACPASQPALPLFPP